MDVTTMHSTPLLKAVKSDYPTIFFVQSTTFSWSAPTKTIYYNPKSPDMAAFLLHELGHAVLDHNSYNQDIDLLRLERDAWRLASTTLCDHYSFEISESTIQETLDTYRDWLHRRSLCPSCHVNGLQTLHGEYFCIACGCRWKTNEARTCALRRTKIKQ